MVKPSASLQILVFAGADRYTAPNMMHTHVCERGGMAVAWRRLFSRMQKAEIRTRWAASFFVLALLVFSVTGWLSGMVAGRAAERSSSALLSQIASSVASQLDTEIVERLREIERLAEFESSLMRDMSQAQWRSALNSVLRINRSFSWIGVTNEQGRVLAATHGLLEGRSVEQRPWFQAGREMPVVQDVHEAKLLAQVLPASPSGEPLRLMDVAAPLKRGDQMVGVLGGHLNLDWAEARRSAALAEQDPSMKLDIVVVDRSGAIILGPRTPQPPKAIADQARRQAGPKVQVWSDGHEYLTAAQTSRPVGEYKGLGWTVVVRQPRAVALETAMWLQTRIVAFGVLGALAFGALAWWLAGVLSAPIHQMALRARELVPANAASLSHNEVDQLAESITQLIETLQARQDELTHLNEHLEDLVRSRTTELEQANTDLRDFTNGVSHDLRAPLGQMANLLRLMATRHAQALPDGMHDSLTMMALECERLFQMCQVFLQMAAVQQSSVHKTSVDTSALVGEVLTELQRAHEGPWPQVEVQALPRAWADPVLLRQVWANLLSNAVKYSALAQPPRIEITARRENGQNIYAVADNGVGFKPEQVAELFTPFKRLNTARGFQGAGIGLVMVRRIVQRQGGEVWAESRPEGGARFYFSLPDHAATDASAAPAPVVPATEA